MSAIHIVDTRVVTSLGIGRDALWRGLLAGHTGIGRVRRFNTDGYTSSVAGCITALDAQRDNSRMAGLIDMLFDESLLVPPDTTLFTATTKAGIDQLEQAVRTQKTAMNHVLGCQVADVVADRLRVKGRRCNINAACASATIALAMGASQIQQGDAESVLVCGLDLVSEFVFSGFSALHALSAEACRPFDTGRDGLVLGEGAACLLLMSERACQQAERRSLGQIVGWGIASDAHHITAPSRTGEGLTLAIRQALEQAGLKPSDVAAINAHGTGSVYNDAMELTSFSTMFDTLPPFHSIKGTLGHTLGACGAIEAIVGLCSLEDQCVPPTVGLQTPEPAGQGHVSTRVQPFSGDYLLTTNSGFGGINGALILQRSAES